MQQMQAPAYEAAILSRIVMPDEHDLNAEAARALLRLELTADDRRRMHELAGKNQSGLLTAAEEQELDSYVRVGRLLDLLAAKARRSLRKRGKDA